MKKLSLVLLSVLLNGLVSAQSANFLKSFTISAAYTSTNSYGIHSMGPNGIAILSPSSFVIGGFYARFAKNGFDTLTSDSYLVKNRMDGYTSWFRKYHLNGRLLSFNDVDILHNYDIIVAGSNYNNGNQLDRDGILMTTDSNGVVKSVRIFTNRDISKVTVLSNKKIAIISKDSLHFPNVALLDKNGNLLWNKQLFHVDTNCCTYYVYEIVEGMNNSLLLVGWKFSNFSTGFARYPFALLCDSSGNKITDFVLPINSGWLYSAAKNYGQGFYLVGAGVNLNGSLEGHCARVNTLLQIEWYKKYQCNMTHVEFSDAILYGPNNINILTEPESAQSNPRRAGFSFMDSTGVIRRTSLFNPNNTDQFPDKMLPISNGKVLFTLNSNAGRLFGITDTMPQGFCDRDTLSWTVANNTTVAAYHNITLLNQSFNYFNDQVFVYLPKDAELIYKCSTGPSGPIDTNIVIITSMPKEIEEVGEEGFEIHPNPVSDYLMIYSDMSRTPVEMSVTDAMGKNLVKMPMAFYNPPYYLDVRTFPNGIYTLTVRSLERELWRKKFIVQK